MHVRLLADDGVTCPRPFMVSGPIQGAMAVKVRGPIPSVKETAAEVGVSAKRASELAHYADTSVSGSLARSLAERSDISSKAAR